MIFNFAGLNKPLRANGVTLGETLQVASLRLLVAFFNLQT